MAFSISRFSLLKSGESWEKSSWYKGAISFLPASTPTTCIIHYPSSLLPLLPFRTRAIYCIFSAYGFTISERSMINHVSCYTRRASSPMIRSYKRSDNPRIAVTDLTGALPSTLLCRTIPSSNGRAISLSRTRSLLWGP